MTGLGPGRPASKPASAYFDDCGSLKMTLTSARSELPETLVDSLEEVREKILGPREAMTADKANFNKKDGKYEGGVGFERSSRAVNLDKAPRAYSLGTTNQDARSLNAPAVGAKIHSTGLDDEALLRLDMLSCGAQAAMTALKKGPPGLYETLRDEAELTNLPRIGSDENIAHPSMQLNVASAEEPTPDQGTSLLSLSLLPLFSEPSGRSLHNGPRRVWSVAHRLQRHCRVPHQHVCSQPRVRRCRKGDLLYPGHWRWLEDGAPLCPFFLWPPLPRRV